MKKFKRLFLSLCVVCLTLFSFTSKTYAYEFKGSTYSLSLINDNVFVNNFYYGSDWNNNHSSGTYTFDEIACSVVISGMGNSLMNVQGQFQCTMNPFVKRLTIYLVNETMGYVQGVKTLYERNEDIITFNCDIQCDFVPDRCYVRLLMRQDYNRSISFGMKYLQINEIDESSESAGIGDVNSGISNIQSDISSIGGTLNTVNSTINTVNSNVFALNESFVTLNNDMKTSSDNIVGAVGAVNAGIAEMYDGLNTGIGAVSAGITANLDKLNSMDGTLSNIEDYMFTTADKLSSIDLTLMLWWNDYLDNTASELQALLNIFNLIDLEVDNIISAIGTHDVNTQVAINNCANAILTGMNTMNTDIQEQMIAQTSNITNNIVSQTNTLNSSIKTMENSIVKKLDDTLVVKDKNEINSNDSSTEELEGAITDYDNVEKNLVTDFNESLDSIDTDSASSIYSQNDFIKTAQFISTNMQNVYESNDFVGGMIDVTLLLGLIFTVIGIGVR